MTRAQVQNQITLLTDSYPEKSDLLQAVKDWIDQQNIQNNEKDQIKKDLNSYDGLEGVF